MFKKSIYLINSFALLLPFFCSTVNAESVVRERPQAWQGLVEGGRFMDNFLPLPKMQQLSSDTWGIDAVKPRYIDNGIEDNTWSYWGGNIIEKDGKYHLFVCRWREDSPKGHMAWPHSEVAHAVADNKLGPYKVLKTIGDGHNPELQQLKDGRYFLYVNQGYYLAESLDGPWQYAPFTYDQRERAITDHMANNTFSKREDGSFLMVGRGGDIWISETGLPPYYQVSEKSVYPAFEGRYEDPVVWRDNIQYHLIVNDWLGRVAYYLRSKNGIDWKLDPGEAYLPGIAKRQDGSIQDWYKFERIKVFQDQYGRAIQANFAVNDYDKRKDLGSDNHSSKNISIPLTVGRLINLVDQQKIDQTSKEIRVKINAEPGFDPQQDIDFSSLHFGASEEVNFGRGSKLLRSEKSGDDLILIFNGQGNGLTDDNFAAKLLGKTKQGALLFAYARLPWVNYQQSILSSKFPELSLNQKRLKVDLNIENFGQVSSLPAKVLIEYKQANKWQTLAKSDVAELAAYEQTTLHLKAAKFANAGEVVDVKVTIMQQDQPHRVLSGKVVVR